MCLYHSILLENDKNSLCWGFFSVIYMSDLGHFFLSIPLNKIGTPEIWDMTYLGWEREARGSWWSRIVSLIESCQKKSIGRTSHVLRILKKGFSVRKCEQFLPDKMENRGAPLGKGTRCHREFNERWNIKKSLFFL